MTGAIIVRTPGHSGPSVRKRLPYSHGGQPDMLSVYIEHDSSSILRSCPTAHDGAAVFSRPVWAAEGLLQASRAYENPLTGESVSAERAFKCEGAGER